MSVQSQGEGFEPLPGVPGEVQVTKWCNRCGCKYQEAFRCPWCGCPEFSLAENVTSQGFASEQPLFKESQ